MAKSDYWQYLVDSEGNALSKVDVRFYLAGTLQEANIFLSADSEVYYKSSEINLKTNKFGFVQFWVADKWENGGYEQTQLFKIVWQNTVDSIEEEIDNLLIFAAVKPIIVNDSIEGQIDNTELNRVISNSLGYKWDTHVGTIVPSASPHDLEAVVFLDLDSKYNKVINNKLGYQIYEMAMTASTTAIDASAARFYAENVNAWTPSGSDAYADITHNFNNYYPIVVLRKISDDSIITPKRVESINPNTVRVWIQGSINTRITVFG